ncbi:hypothetical protein [Wielerella bovis]|uniref:hypothetical protein n=2 Tax=Wielerella bovis TaxID=2917790 RepID=UPI002018E2CF|nr:hypothetical protein [Wielerella bovis]MCG7657515.1 hypothetical protein [Wielerella bovis]MCG7659736.1 hypothetical protein [Wielerella bovis]ULJ64094.1 hypothetical protein MIS33_07985 [Wielerella bovis]ULJ67992.1 hypothetical protein MIS31_05495 [Wielerella bovis]
MKENKIFIFHNDAFMAPRIFTFFGLLLAFLFSVLFASYIEEDTFFIYAFGVGTLLSTLLFFDMDIKSIEINYREETLKLIFSNIFKTKIIVLNRYEIQYVRLSKIPGYTPFSLIEMEISQNQKIKLCIPLKVISNWFGPIKEEHDIDVITAFNEIKDFKNLK